MKECCWSLGSCSLLHVSDSSTWSAKLVTRINKCTWPHTGRIGNLSLPMGFRLHLPTVSFYVIYFYFKSSCRFVLLCAIRAYEVLRLARIVFGLRDFGGKKSVNSKKTAISDWIYWWGKSVTLYLWYYFKFAKILCGSVNSFSRLL